MRDVERNAFERAAEERQRSFLGEFYEFLKHNQKFYLIPIAVVLLLIGVLIVLGGTAAAPFIYTVF